MAACVSRVQVLFLSVSAGSSQTDGINRLKPSSRCGTAVSVTGTRVTAPWKCSNRIAFIGDGVDANRSIMRSMSASEIPLVKLDIQ